MNVRFEVAPIDYNVLKQAVDVSFADYEDAVLYVAGMKAGAEVIVTRDISGFSKATLPVLSPEEYLANVSSS